MTTGYGGKYRATVADNADPRGENRLRVVVPEVTGTDPVWAKASLAPGSTAVPAVGDEVLVSYEHGDTEYAVWELGAASSGGAPSRGYLGKYPASVVDNADPLGQGRLQVSVPEVLGTDSTWATPGPSVGSGAPPEIEADVWVEFEGGDPGRPVWVGMR